MSDNTLIEKIIKYIEKNLDADLSLDKISKDLCYSKFYIARVFVEKTMPADEALQYGLPLPSRPVMQNSPACR